MTYITNNYPTSIQTAVDPTATDQVATFDHAGLEKFQNDSIDALKAKVGVDSSAVTTSHDYKLSEVVSGDKSVGKTATQTLSGKTLTAPKIATGGFIADENGNEQIKFATTASAVNEVLVTNAATGNAPAMEASGSDSNIDLSLKGKGTGKVKFGTANIKLPNSDGTSGQVLMTDGAGVLSFGAAASSNVITVTAGENLTVNDAVFVADGTETGPTLTAGRVYRTSADDNAHQGSYYKNFIGFVTATVTSGNPAIIQMNGVVTTFSGLTVGKIYFMSDTLGAIATTQGTRNKKVGISASATQLVILLDSYNS